MHVALKHITHYQYDRHVSLGPQIIRLRPAPHCRTRIVSYSLRVHPERHFVNWQQDPQSNYLAQVVFPEKTTELTIAVELIAEIRALNPFAFVLEQYAQRYPFDYEAGERRELAPYLLQPAAARPEMAKFSQYLATIPTTRMRTIDFMVALNQRLFQDIKYVIRLEPGVQTPEETLRKASGSCRDSAWLLAQLLRHSGLATRFVSGYLIQLVADAEAPDGLGVPIADFTDLHAWCEVYLPGAGWVGLDPTSGLMAGEGHIPLACTPEPASAAPVTGVVDESQVKFAHHMSVQRTWENPQTIQPFADEEGRRVQN